MPTVKLTPKPLLIARLPFMAAPIPPRKPDPLPMHGKDNLGPRCEDVAPVAPLPVKIIAPDAEVRPVVITASPQPVPVFLAPMPHLDNLPALPSK